MHCSLPGQKYSSFKSTLCWFCVGVQITAYSTDRVLSEKTDKQSDRLIFYGEPTPETVGPLLGYTKDLPIQKMLVMDEKPRTDELRPALVEALGGRAEITVAIPGMLEVDPGVQ